MRIYSFNKEQGKSIDSFGSRNMVITPIMKSVEEKIKFVQMGCIHLLEDGVIGGHEASVSQIFIVITGSGWVTGKEKLNKEIKAGELAFWESGEWHEVRTEQGMTAVVVESDSIYLMEKYLKEIDTKEIVRVNSKFRRITPHSRFGPAGPRSAEEHSGSGSCGQPPSEVA
ncbi:DUF2793 domain-containing protein [Paenibacillus sp. TRM 82003]|nr:DUF2793 domain-containing protein [Paenibacillus sp. TRM 82003]